MRPRTELLVRKAAAKAVHLPLLAFVFSGIGAGALLIAPEPLQGWLGEAQGWLGACTHTTVGQGLVGVWIVLSLGLGLIGCALYGGLAFAAAMRALDRNRERIDELEDELEGARP